MVGALPLHLSQRKREVEVDSRGRKNVLARLDREGARAWRGPSRRPSRAGRRGGEGGLEARRARPSAGLGASAPPTANRYSGRSPAGRHRHGPGARKEGDEVSIRLAPKGGLW